MKYQANFLSRYELESWNMSRQQANVLGTGLAAPSTLGTRNANTHFCVDGEIWQK